MHRIRTEEAIILRIKELREPFVLLDSLGTRSVTAKTQEQFSRERAFIDGMCQGAYRFLDDLTPIATWLRLAKRAEKETHNDD